VPADFVAPAGAEASEIGLRDRIIDAITREARLVTGAGIATEADIALALRLGAGHPRDLLADE
jgi:hypothetical protein